MSAPIQLADSCILAWVLLNTGACANAALCLLTQERGKFEFVFDLQICTKTLIQQLQNSQHFLGTIPRTPVLGERKVCFRSPKMYQNSPTVTAMMNSKIFRETKPRTFVSGESLFSFSKNVLKLSYSNAEFNKFPGDNTPDPRFRGEESLFLFFENVPKLSCSNAEFKHYPGTIPGTPGLGEKKVCFRSPKMYQNSPTAI